LGPCNYGQIYTGLGLETRNYADGLEMAAAAAAAAVVALTLHSK